MNQLKRIAGAGHTLLMALCITVLGVAVCSNLSGDSEDKGGGAAAVFATPAQYRKMVLVTPKASDSVTITGGSVYYWGTTYVYDWEKGVFIENRTVTLSPFKIAKYETTYELWYEVKQWAAGHGYIFANEGTEGHDGTEAAAPTAGKLEPVTEINWRDAIVWCNAYSEMSGKEPVYYLAGTTDFTNTKKVLRVSTSDSRTNTAADQAVMKPGADGYRLPTEAEWEYAARGGGTPDPSGTFADAWAGTNDESVLGNYAWYCDNACDATHPVGEKTEKGLGLYDMSGNVWEWCWDWYDSIDTGTAANPLGPDSGEYRVYRGGGWYGDASYCAVSYRFSYSPSHRNYGLGFRVACR